MVTSCASAIGGDRHGRAVEVSPRHDVVGVREHHGIVGRGISLDRERRPRKGEGVACRAVDLGRAAHRVRVLHAAAVLVRPVDRALGEQRTNIFRGGTLAWMRTGRVDARIKWMHRSSKRIN